MQTILKTRLLVIVLLVVSSEACLAVLTGVAPVSSSGAAVVNMPSGRPGGAVVASSDNKNDDPTAEATKEVDNAAKASKIKNKQDAYIAPQPMMDSDTLTLVMQHSLDDFEDYCACPFSKNSDGFQCGVESAYYKPGGTKILCYPEDVRGQLRIFYRKTH